MRIGQVTGTVKVRRIGDPSNSCRARSMRFVTRSVGGCRRRWLKILRGKQLIARRQARIGYCGSASTNRCVKVLNQSWICETLND